MKFLDVFSGIGGFRIGMEKAGFECIGHIEIDKFANQSYRAIHNVKENEYVGEDIITMLEQHDYVKMAVKHFNENYAEYSYIVDEETVITPTLGEVSEICTRVKKRRGWIYE